MKKTINSLLLGLALPACMLGNGVALAGLATDLSIEFTSAQPRYDALQRRFVVSGRLTNISAAAIQSPISLVIDGFQPANHSVSIQNPDGILADGKYYKVVYPQGELSAGQYADFEFYLQFGNPLSSDAVAAFEQVVLKAFKQQVPAEARFNFDYHLIRIPAGNQSPIANAGDDLGGDVGSAVVLNGSLSSDPNNDPISYDWKLVVKPPGSSAQLVNALTVSPSLTADLPGDYQASLTVSDGYVLSQADKVLIKINAVSGINQPPKINSSAPTTATATRTYNYQVTAGDPDEDPLVFRLKDPPIGMTINATGFVEWNVPNTPHAMPKVTIEVDDGRGGIAQQSFSIHIEPCTCIP